MLTYIYIYIYYIYVFQYIKLVKPTEYKQRQTVKNNDTKDYNSNTEIEETKKLFNDLRNNFSREEIKKQKNFIKKNGFIIT